MKTVFAALALASTMLLAVPASANPSATQMMNVFRANQGKAAVAYSPRLEQAAQSHADDMARHGYFSHTDRRGKKVQHRVEAAGYKWCYAAENIAQGQKSLQTVMQAWVDSPGHRRNMENSKARHFAVARGANNFWVMVLASPC